MIRRENVTIGDKQYIRTYSDSGVMIRRDGVDYCDALDPIDSDRAYSETDISIHNQDISDSEALTIILGGEV